MSPEAKMDIRPYLESIGKLASASMTEIVPLMKQEATLAIYNSNPSVPGVINITPPFSPRAKDGASALAAGRLAIRRDLGAVFVPVKLKGQRAITQVFGRQLASPIYVPTKEIHPDVAAIAAQRRARKNESAAKRMSRGRKQAYYVDEQKLVVELRESYSMIGLAAACWYVAALESGLKPRGVPEWVARHGSAFGAGVIEITAHSIRIDLSSSLPYNTALGMADKMNRVLGYREKALQRRLPYVFAALAKKANLALT